MLKDPRTAAAVLGPLIADQPVEVFAVACLSTKRRLLAWHVLSRGWRACTPVSIVVKIVPNDKGNPSGKLADAELHFTEGELDGLKLVGFAVWEGGGGGGGGGPGAVPMRNSPYRR
jgi:hypothetical protein